jgi:hypothetical protein
MKRSSYFWVHVFCVTVLLSLLVVQVGCGPSRPAATPAEARFAEMQKAMDEVKYEKAITLAADINSKYADSESADKARVLRTIMLAGIADGYKSMAEAYIRGSENAKRNAGVMRSTALDYYRKQKSTAFQLFEAVNVSLKAHAENKAYVIACKFPPQDIGINRYLETAGKGTAITADEVKAAENDEIQNGVVRMLVKFMGSDDRSSARKALESGTFPIEASQYYVTLTRALLDNQKIFDKGLLNEKERYQLFFQKAVECYDLADKLLKAKPNQNAQILADEVKEEIEALKKKGLKAS